MNELDNDEKDQLKKYLKNFAKRAFNSKNKEKLYDTNKLLFSFFNCEYSEPGMCLRIEYKNAKRCECEKISKSFCEAMRMRKISKKFCEAMRNFANFRIMRFFAKCEFSHANFSQNAIFRMRIFAKCEFRKMRIFACDFFAKCEFRMQFSHANF